MPQFQTNLKILKLRLVTSWLQLLQFLQTANVEIHSGNAAVGGGCVACRRLPSIANVERESTLSVTAVNQFHCELFAVAQS